MSTDPAWSDAREQVAGDAILRLADYLDDHADEALELHRLVELLNDYAGTRENLRLFRARGDDAYTPEEIAEQEHLHRLARVEVLRTIRRLAEELEDPDDEGAQQ